MSNIIKFEEEKQQLEHFKQLAKIASESGQYRDMSPTTMLNIMLSARDLGVSPLKAINGGFYIVNGKISMSTALMADRIRKEGHSVKIPEWTDQKCVIIGIRKDNQDSVKFEYTMEDAQRAGLTGSPTWKKFPKQMLYNRAMSTLARTLFPDVVGNAYSEDEKYDVLNVPPKDRPLEDPDTISVSTVRENRTTEIDADKEPSFDVLKDILDVDGMDCSRLQEYVDHLCKKKGTNADKVIESALMPGLTERFKGTYVKWLEETSVPSVV